MHNDPFIAPVIANATLWGMLRHRWFAAPGLPQDDHMRGDIGLAPLRPRRRISPLVFAWLH